MDDLEKKVREIHNFGVKLCDKGLKTIEVTENSFELCKAIIIDNLLENSSIPQEVKLFIMTQTLKIWEITSKMALEKIKEVKGSDKKEDTKEEHKDLDNLMGEIEDFYKEN